MDRARTILFAVPLLMLLSACAVSSETGAASDTTGAEPDPESEPREASGGSGSGGETADPGKPGCAETAYTETLPASNASLASLSFSPSTANDFLLGALGARYPLGQRVVEGGLTSDIAARQGNCIDRFLDDRSSKNAVLRQAATVVHECGHFFDLGESSGTTSTFIVRPDLKFSCDKGDTTSRGGKTFARSLLNDDAYASKRPACGGSYHAGCDSYADVYLDGSASDGTFQSGDQGYSFVLEEANQYVNSLATALAFEDQYTNTRTSERDGILTFLWYIERYLKMAREEYPEAYALLSEDECWRQATLSVWDRGWFYLDATKGMDSLGLDDAGIEALATDAKLTQEIDTLRRLECK